MTAVSRFTASSFKASNTLNRSATADSCSGTSFGRGNGSTGNAGTGLTTGIGPEGCGGELTEAFCCSIAKVGSAASDALTGVVLTGWVASGGGASDTAASTGGASAGAASTGGDASAGDSTTSSTGCFGDSINRVELGEFFPVVPVIAVAVSVTVVAAVVDEGDDNSSGVSSFEIRSVVEDGVLSVKRVLEEEEIKRDR